MSHGFPPPKQPWTGRGLRRANDISQARFSGSSLSLSNFPTFSDSNKAQLIGLETFT